MSEDSGHYYTTAGEPCYEVPTKKGTMRGINLRWDSKLGLVPSVTTVGNIQSKPPLTRWMVEQAILAALTLPRHDDWSERDYINAIREDSQRQAMEAADKGTLIHDQLEMYMDGRNAFVSEQWMPTALRVREILEQSFPDVTDWVTEKAFAHPSGFGGRVDLHSPSTGIVVDYKTKDSDFTDDKRLAYDQNIQLAAYQKGLGLTENVCANIFVSREIPGAAVIHIWSREDIRHGWEVFQRQLALWKAVKKYDPSFQENV